MKASVLYREAASIVGTTCDTRCQLTCCAIYTVDKEDNEVLCHRYREIFRPNADEERGWWNSRDDHYTPRVLALLLMSEIAKDEEKTR